MWEERGSCGGQSGRASSETDEPTMSEAADLKTIIINQHFDFMAAMAAESDLHLAFHLQMEEAMAASIATLPPSDRPSFSATPSASSPSSSQPIAATADRGGCAASQSRARAIYLHAREVLRFQVETMDRHRSLALVRMAVENIRRVAHDERFALKMRETPDDEWEDYGDEFERSIEAAGVAEPNFRLYFKGLTSQHESKGVLATFTAVAAIICDCNDNPVLRITKWVTSSELATFREMLEAKALVEGLNAVISLGIKRIDVFFDYKTLFNHVKGIWGLKRMNISNVINEVQVLMGKFEICEMFLVERCHMQPLFRLLRDFIDLQTQKNVVDQVGRARRETCSICLVVRDSSKMFSIKECLHRFCLSCMKKQVKIKLLNGILPACPHDGCKVMLDVKGARKFLPPRLLELMNQSLKEASIPATEKVYCPYPKCSALMSKNEAKSEAICPQQASSSKQLRVHASGLRKCIKCNRYFCINCKVPWHEMQSCNEFIRFNPNLHPEEAELISLAEKKLWRQCVKCNHIIERSGGCLCITCRCGCEFCYACGAEWKDKHQTCKCFLLDYIDSDSDDDFSFDEVDEVDDDDSFDEVDDNMQMQVNFEN